MKRTKLIMIAFAVSAAAAFQTASANPSEHFNKIDADANGVVNEAEFVTWKTTEHDYTVEDAKAKFADWAGTDGQLTLVEYGEALERHHRGNCNKSKDQST